MVRQQFAFGQQLLGHLEESDQVFGIVQVRCDITDLTVHLRQCGAGHAVLTTAQVQQQQFAVHTGFQLRGHRQVDVGHRREGRNHQRHGRGDAFIDALVVPDRTHGQRILAHRNGDTQLRTQVHAHRFHRIEQSLVFTRVTRRSHPVGRHADLAQIAQMGAGNIGD